MITLNNIHKVYAVGTTEQKVLNGISLQIQQGEMVAIMGASGSGKSTLMNIIGLLDVPSSGDYVLDQHPTADWDEATRAAWRNTHIGFVFQQFCLLPRLSVAQNVALPLQYRHGDMKHMTVTDVLAQVGLSDKANHQPDQLSGGQQQRIAIARALIGRPHVILADEPTGALDSQTSQEIMQLFALLNQQGATIIIVTHDSSIAQYCQRIVHIIDGRIVEAA